MLCDGFRCYVGGNQALQKTIRGVAYLCFCWPVDIEDVDSDDIGFAIKNLSITLFKISKHFPGVLKIRIFICESKTEMDSCPRVKIRAERCSVTLPSVSTRYARY